MIPFTREDGLRDYRVSARAEPQIARARWPWLVLVVCVVGALLVRVLR